MQTDRHGFLAALAAYIVSQISGLTLGSSLFVYELVEDGSTLKSSPPAPASVLIPYDGASPWVPVAELSLQIKTIGPNNVAAMQRAQAMHGALQDAQGRPLTMTTMSSFRLNAVTNLRGPSMVGRDAQGRIEIVSNCDLEFVPLSG
jgi:hypothetical protein